MHRIVAADRFVRNAIALPKALTSQTKAGAEGSAPVGISEIT
jgi:hypothetical protein